MIVVIYLIGLIICIMSFVLLDKWLYGSISKKKMQEIRQKVIADWEKYEKKRELEIVK